MTEPTEPTRSSAYQIRKIDDQWLVVGPGIRSPSMTATTSEQAAQALADTFQNVYMTGGDDARSEIRDALGIINGE